MSEPTAGQPDVAEQGGDIAPAGTAVVDLIASLGTPTDEESAITELIRQVDLSSVQSNKWDAVRRKVASILYDSESDWADRVGATGMKDRASLNQLPNRVRQAGVQGVDTTVFVVGEAVLIPHVARALAKVVENPDTRLKQACIVLRDDEREEARIVRIIEQEAR